MSLRTTEGEGLPRAKMGRGVYGRRRARNERRYRRNVRFSPWGQEV